ncbi:hypothetical protein ACZ90_22760 [Streptomyces albus subsp. albus]|nr:hypothetical protein ACZ90_22760 [Streptomyces albus subsp. albus]
MRARAAAAIAALLCLPLAACSGDNSDDKPAAGTPADKANIAGKNDTEALEKSVRDYTAALFGGDASGYDLVSQRCQAELSRDQYKAMSEQAHNDYGSLTIKTIKVDQISGDMARVSYGVGVPQFERKGQPWTREDGTWRWDAC